MFLVPGHCLSLRDCEQVNQGLYFVSISVPAYIVLPKLRYIDARPIPVYKTGSSELAQDLGCFHANFKPSIHNDTSLYTYNHNIRYLSSGSRSKHENASWSARWQA